MLSQPYREVSSTPLELEMGIGPPGSSKPLIVAAFLDHRLRLLSSWFKCSNSACSAKALHWQTYVLFGGRGRTWGVVRGYRARRAVKGRTLCARASRIDRTYIMTVVR